MKNWSWPLAALLGIAVAGCGPSSPPTYPVAGRIELAQGDVSALAGCHVEAMLRGDPYVRASGEIQPDGTFRLQTQHQGSILAGAKEGAYQVRILLADDDPAQRKKARALVADRYQKFETSGFSFQVPGVDSNLILRLAPRGPK